MSSVQEKPARKYDNFRRLYSKTQVFYQFHANRPVESNFDGGVGFVLLICVLLLFVYR